MSDFESRGLLDWRTPKAIAPSLYYLTHGFKQKRGIHSFLKGVTANVNVTDLGRNLNLLSDSIFSTSKTDYTRARDEWLRSLCAQFKLYGSHPSPDANIWRPLQNSLHPKWALPRTFVIEALTEFSVSDISCNLSVNYVLYICSKIRHKGVGSVIKFEVSKQSEFNKVNK